MRILESSCRLENSRWPPLQFGIDIDGTFTSSADFVRIPVGADDRPFLATSNAKLIATNIGNVIMAHIHCAPPGINGPIRIWLYPNIGPTGAQGPNATGRDGILASGTFAPRTVTCPAANGHPAMPLLEAIRAGLTYVNVHTNDGVAPTNTGPGDFPGGEIRGQLDRPGNSSKP